MSRFKIGDHVRVGKAFRDTYYYRAWYYHNRGVIIGMARTSKGIIAWVDFDGDKDFIPAKQLKLERRATTLELYQRQNDHLFPYDMSFMVVISVMLGIIPFLTLLF